MLKQPVWKVIFTLIVCLLALYTALPSFFPKFQGQPWAPSRTIALGLDLQGGSYLLLQVDEKSYFREQNEHLVDAMRTHLRKERVGYKDLAAGENGVSFTLRDAGQAEKIAPIIRQIDDRYSAEINGDKVSLGFTEMSRAETTRQLLEQSIEIVRRRVDETGTREPIIARQGDTRILLQVPGLQDPAHLKQLLGKTAKLTFHMVNETYQPTSSRPADIPDGYMVLPYEADRAGGHNAGFVAVERKSQLSGDMLVDAHATFERGAPVVNFRFNSHGARVFGEVTTNYVQQRFAVVLDGKVITAPNINEPILGGSGMISGNFTVESANDLALLLRAGALPAPLSVIEERTVGPSLGSDSIDAGANASMLAVVLVIGFMLVRYKLFGVFASIGLVLNIVLLMAGMALLQATLTLPGIAGIALTMGMSVDANVLIFERIKEELRSGRTPASAILAGFDRAFATIMDSNLTTLIATALLYYFGTGPIKGFAVTLSLGIITSMFTAVTVTKIIIATYVDKRRPKALAL
jgi:preprotein translocase subunit SecD